MEVLTELEKRVEKQQEVLFEKDLEKQLSEKYQIFIGHMVNKSIHRIKGKALVEFAEALGDLNPKYVKVGVKEDEKIDYSTIHAHPCYPNTFTIDAAFDVTSWRFPPTDGETEEKLLIPIPNKILHTGQSYDYSRAETSIQNRQKLYTNGYCTKIYVKNNRLWINIHLDTRTKEGLLVVQSTVQFVVREGGFAQ